MPPARFQGRRYQLCVTARKEGRSITNQLISAKIEIPKKREPLGEIDANQPRMPTKIKIVYKLPTREDRPDDEA